MQAKLQTLQLETPLRKSFHLLAVFCRAQPSQQEILCQSNGSTSSTDICADI
jgi:hypothetical protein